ncbi:hypothetical protein NPIL_335121 [Nephila pilipes]|uniref:Uncharacterized protein n=1 Tax=Nephila pilipes TaxID=299642 RepID=A0A8X6NHI7_NEPPI|nr:hypothetical protein NPIL_335121 [Nephila pilipes]
MPLFAIKSTWRGQNENVHQVSQGVMEVCFVLLSEDSSEEGSGIRKARRRKCLFAGFDELILFQDLAA